MATTIVTKSGSGAPTASDLVAGELAVDLTNKRLYTEDSGGTVLELGTNPTTLVVDTDTLVVDATNNRVGIGTAAPSSRLQLDGAEDRTGGLTLSAGGQNHTYFLSSDFVNVHNIETSSAAAAHTWQTNGTERLRIDASGNVGIGVTPVTTLDVKGASDLVASFRSSTNNGNTSEAKIRAVDSDSSHVATFLFQGYEHRFQNASGTEAMRIDSSGRVGIGMTPISDRVLSLYASGNSILSMHNSTTGTGTGDGFQIQLVSDDAYLVNYEPGGFMSFYTAPSGGSTLERMRIDASGNLGIGLNNPSAYYAESLVVAAADEGGITIECGSTEKAYLMFADGTSGNAAYRGYFGYDHALDSMNIVSHGYMNFYTNDPSTEKMRLDASGNLLVGKTAVGTNTAGFEARSTGFIGATRADVSAYFTRLTTNGDIIQFRKDGATVGSIGVGAASDYLAVGNSNTSIQFYASGIAPASGSVSTLSDNTKDIGSASVRWNDAYITNGVTTGSDRNQKQDIETLSDAEQRVAVACKGLLRKWRWIDAVEAKGDEARIHFGIIAQDLQAAFEAEGLDAGRYAMFMSNTWTDDDGNEQTRLGVRYSELLAFIIAAI